jgi:hypothetical protein
VDSQLKQAVIGFMELRSFMSRDAKLRIAIYPSKPSSMLVTDPWPSTLFSIGPDILDERILSTTLAMFVRSSSQARVLSRFCSAILADLTIRGLAISFLTLARVEPSSSFLSFL